MNEEQLDCFVFGYDECRGVIRMQLEKILAQKAGHRIALKNFLNKLEKEEERDHWDQIQKEFPGITREEYESEMNECVEAIRQKYYSEKGFLKPRLARGLT